MAIVLTVLGLLLGSVLVPLNNRLQGAHRDEAIQQLEQIELALLSYAVNHVTNSTDVVLNLPLNRGIARTRIPSGRPYLPCPDINGDGLEDRITRLSSSLHSTLPHITPISTEALPGIIVTLTTGITTTDRERTLVRSSAIIEPRVTISISNSDRFTNFLMAARGTVCASDFGSVPWSTLGTPPQDPWGNRFAYRVDPMFSNSIIGFGKETRSDTLDPRFGLSITVSNSTTLTVYQLRETNVIQSRYVGFDGRDISATLNDNPGIVCTLASNAGCSSTLTLTNGNHALFNDVTVAPLTLFDVYANITIARLYQPDDVVNGMAFVVLSYGPNSRGAVPHQQGINFTSAGVGIRCILSNNGGTINSNFPENENSSCSPLPALATSHAFVKIPVNNTADAYFDDELRFMTGDLLIGTLARFGFQYGQPWIPPGP